MPIVYIDRSDVTAGMAADLRRAVAELVAFVEAREAQLISYNFSIDEDASAMAPIAVHPDSASLELHLTIGAPEFRKVGAFITLRAIEVFGEPSPAAVKLLDEKAKMLGDATVTIHPPDAGFSRLPGIG